MDKEDCVGRDFLIGRHKVTIEEIERWIAGVKDILKDRPEFHSPYIEWSNSEDGDDPFIYIVASRPETEIEISIRKGQEKHTEKEDRKHFDYLKEKYDW